MSALSIQIRSAVLEFIIVRSVKYLIFSFCLANYFIETISAQDAGKYDFDRIEDNSFLIEEAYNQDPGVIQHISSFQYLKQDTWIYTFTDEWPVPGMKHQLSFTLPVLSNGSTGLGDIELNYRYQAIHLKRLAFSPRLSLLFPTGNYHKSLGSGVPGYQVSLPFSFLLSRKVVTHYNLGITYIPISKNADGSKSNIVIYNYGLSIIILLHTNFNFMFETVGYTTITKENNANTQIFNILLINPGFRYAINFKSGLQIVPGIATPIGIGSSAGEFNIFAYLSFEHPLWKPKP
jgi:hypothetical protein